MVLSQKVKVVVRPFLKLCIYILSLFGEGPFSWHCPFAALKPAAIFKSRYSFFIIFVVVIYSSLSIYLFFTKLSFERYNTKFLLSVFVCSM